VLITVESLSVRYGNRVVLDDISFSMQSGTVVAIVGPSGSGKSTLLAVVAGELEPTAGHVRFAEAWDGRVSWIPQQSRHIGHRSTVSNAALGALSQGSDRADAKAAARRALEQVHLSEVADLAARHLSGGELQRLAVARALCTGHPIVLADEPTANLDKASAQSVACAMITIAKHGRLVVIATHDLAVADLADQVITL